MNGMLLKQSCDKKNTGALEKTRKFRKTTLLVGWRHQEISAQTFSRTSKGAIKTKSSLEIYLLVEKYWKFVFADGTELEMPILKRVKR
jgi:hypothetical protein